MAYAAWSGRAQNATARPPADDGLTRSVGRDDPMNPTAPEQKESTDTVRACPHCNIGGNLRAHTGPGHNANDREAYLKTDYTCKKCGEYLTASEVIERAPRSNGTQVIAASILLREDITTWEGAREASRARAGGGDQ